MKILLEKVHEKLFERTAEVIPHEMLKVALEKFLKELHGDSQVKFKEEFLEEYQKYFVG